jgi:SAM-dependent methyltransferase
MTLAFTNQEQHPMIATLLRTRVPRWEELDRTIDERDDMLDFALQMFERDRDVALTSYFQNGLEQFEVVKQIAAWRGKPRRMLDFASGYGRLTRFLVHQHLAGEITVSDILEGGMEFQASQFGVRTILSTPLPSDFTAPSKYDLIFVASLFTHLPPATFTPWLQRLASLLEPEGLLLFSVHDESIAPSKVSEGISFESYSESRVLDSNDYGSTWVTEDYVRSQVAAIDPSFACVRLPRALSNWQDLYVISPSPLTNVPFRRAPKGFIERCEVVAEGVRFSGWGTSVDEPADRVEVRIDDELAVGTRDFHPRPDVAAAHQSEAATHSAFEAIVPHAAIRSFRYQTATVSVFSRENAERILFLGTIDSATGFAAKERAKVMEQNMVRAATLLAELEHRNAVLDHQRAELDQIIAAMKQSRFWKARERWFAVKRGIGWTDEA